MQDEEIELDDVLSFIEWAEPYEITKIKRALEYDEYFEVETLEDEMKRDLLYEAYKKFTYPQLVKLLENK